MSGHPQEGHYDDGYGHAQGTDSYYHDDQQQGYYDQHQDYQPHSQGGDGYYDET
jgi:1,3-beta-glucan synthase